MREIEINGIKYQEKSKPKVSKTVSNMLLMSMAMGGAYTWGGGKKEPEHPNVNIIEEYALIQHKKSDLTKSQRDWVESEFESKYEKV